MNIKAEQMAIIKKETLKKSGLNTFSSEKRPFLCKSIKRIKEKTKPMQQAIKRINAAKCADAYEVGISRNLYR